MTSLPFVERYRPTTLDLVEAHEDILRTIKNFAKQEQLPHMLFHGPPGCGKTTTILAVAHQLYGDQRGSCVLELNASDDRGINLVRTQVKTFAETKVTASLHDAGSKTLTSRVKLVILDEADQMTSAAQNSLRRILEQYIKNVRFCFICNYKNKMHPAIVSRCSSFRFGPLPKVAMQNYLVYVADAEKIGLTQEATESLLQYSNGDMRRVLNTLQSASLACPNKEITAETIATILGFPNREVLSSLFEQLCTANFATCTAKLHSLMKEEGISCNIFVNDAYTRAVDLHWPEPVLTQLVIRLANIEERINLGGQRYTQSAALVAAFIEARHALSQLGVKS